MGRYEIDMEITGFKLRIRGDHADIPVIKHNLQNKMVGLIDPAANIAQSRLPSNTIDVKPVVAEANGKAKKARRSRRGTASNPETKSQALEFRHDPERFGIPRQEWPATKKITWLMHIASQQAQVMEVSGPAIAATFNKHFRQAGQLRKANMPRDLGSLKQRVPALVGDNADSSPICWFLTTEGQKEAERLVEEAKGAGTQSS